jgi:hypothetical protein
MYLGDSPREVKVGQRHVKVLDPWRAGLLCAFVPFYSWYWWYRSSSELKAYGNAAQNDNLRLSPPLMVALVVLGNTFLPRIFAVALLSQAISAAQKESGTNRRIGFLVLLVLMLLAWAAGPIAIVLVLTGGMSSGAALAVVIFGLFTSAVLTSVLYEDLQANLNAAWSSPAVVRP